MNKSFKPTLGVALILSLGLTSVPANADIFDKIKKQLDRPISIHIGGTNILKSSKSLNQNINRAIKVIRKPAAVAGAGALCIAAGAASAAGTAGTSAAGSAALTAGCMAAANETINKNL